MEPTTSRPQVSRSVGLGALAGIVAGLAMAMFAMIAAATYQNTGFFTPMYHIASTFIQPTAMETSMKQAMGGDLYYFSAGPAALGMAIHMMTAITFGVIFALLAASLGLRGAVAPIAGVVYGLGVFALMSFAVLPVIADLFGGGKPIADMPKMVGYTTFGLEHTIYGLVLGLVLAPQRAYANVRQPVTRSAQGPRIQAGSR
ncbi:MAG: hypothetical protein M3277_03080 [Actinomycetota bacterium]|nr:hypothetical protein [Actinomycetota bacterium]